MASAPGAAAGQFGSFKLDFTPALNTGSTPGTFANGIQDFTPQQFFSGAPPPWVEDDSFDVNEFQFDVNQGVERTSMDGVELNRCLANFTTLAEAMSAAVPAAQKERIKRWRVTMEKAITAFNRGAAIALADIWHIDKSAAMGEAFREWNDTIIDGLGPECGLPYLGREYVNILPAHWLTEPDHLEQFSSQLWQEHGVLPGSGSDAVMEMVSAKVD